ncbi:unnamed protein product [Clonostachys rosea f. rosea IK726]|uniref:Uncharacterized protein n=2 Tax=Clonostachys rosea f. rosea IK726 TaxID=1349383 RepID=A0ACA9UVF1_BIOOC|nr:unnamed protein product [Clonostachys rosea f. rosea IK726]CAG9957415.1 unnamed protein product [Clonostachys rosea f. rosea IK726]
MGGLPSPEDVRQLLGPPKQTALPFNNVNQAVNPAAQSVPKSEEEQALQKNWPMFPRGPLRDYLDGFVRMHNRPPGIEGLRLVGVCAELGGFGHSSLGRVSVDGLVVVFILLLERESIAALIGF